jgi:capsular polysaccharide biosynthesis protein
VSRELRNYYSLPCHERKKRRIYIDREGASIRKIINNAEVKTLLSEYGFEFCNLEKMSLREKQEIFSCAEIVVGPLGAGFSNLVFCNENTKVLILYQEKFETDSFWSLCQNNMLHHFHLISKSSGQYFPSKFSNTFNEDFLINIDDLRASMDYLIGYNIV